MLDAGEKLIFVLMEQILVLPLSNFNPKANLESADGEQNTLFWQLKSCAHDRFQVSLKAVFSKAGHLTR